MTILFFCEECGGSIDVDDIPTGWDYDRDGAICPTCVVGRGEGGGADAQLGVGLPGIENMATTLGSCQLCREASDRVLVACLDTYLA